jgi:hypothetical protein
VRARGSNWTFTVPEQHRLEIDEERRRVVLATPLEGSVFELAGIEETSEERVVSLGDELESERWGPPGVGERVPEPRGYSLPTIDVELARLKARWREVGGNPVVAETWARKRLRDPACTAPSHDPRTMSQLERTAHRQLVPRGWATVGNMTHRELARRKAKPPG